jgi:CDP-glucose 4,6-dehydratase
MKESFGRVYSGKRVLITGHTGFKGSWLALWLSQMGAKVIGYALLPSTSPSHINLLHIDCLSVTGDIRDDGKLHNVIRKEQPEIIFHLAAQSLVRRSYQEPVDTLDTNVMGTVKLLETCRRSPSVKAVVVVTSDKCYENREWLWGYRENDTLGGYDPYSASKACAELVTSSYRHSFFPVDKYGHHHSILLASARAGNVIGGGDWAEDRLIPDIARAVSKNEAVFIRNPDSVRPWQHVLEPLSGYLMLGQKLLQGEPEFADAWNFGPGEDGNLKVEMLVKQLTQYWNGIDYRLSSVSPGLHEANSLQLDCSKARIKLHWRPVWDINKALEMTGIWYDRFYRSEDVISEQQLTEYVHTAERKNIEWTGS